MHTHSPHKHSHASTMAGVIPVWIALVATLSVFLQGINVKAATFDITNQCPYTVWAAASPGGGRQLAKGQTWTIQVAAGTTGGRVWARTGCSFDGSGRGTCQTGDCNGMLSCQGYGQVPATLAEYALNQFQNLDFYDISLVDGFNVPLSMTPTSTNPNCKGRITCLSHINSMCPAELKVNGGCKSACARYNTAQYCCTGASANNCGPTNYSKFFKGQCPQAYSYAKDDATSTFTCPSGTNYKVVFCG
ncbi:pathogenesis-related thaumatin-like protein 3.1 [Cryptomeria japonica]|uniref:pathogenesis-related thaumatin-like protein 3.1 precursor n=1 Tax=Cryptomeria japonica TaxID=3369 RepID=UPI0027DA6ACA|nr:pathogenesis-related thaumatin-like protein 3.1 [Cryptomeria japonica]